MHGAGEWGIVQTVAPAVEPVSLEQARSWVRVDGTAEDATILTLIKAARRFVEQRTNRALIDSEWKFTQDRFPVARFGDPALCGQAAIEIPKGPVTDIIAVKYVDMAGVEQTLTAGDDYLIDLAREPVRITPAWGKAWPSARNQIAAVTVEFAAGYQDAAAVPEDLTLAMRLLIGHWFQNRETVVVGTANSKLQLAFDSLVDEFRPWRFR